MEPLAVAHRFWTKIASTSSGCWLWGASRGRNGYARFGWRGNAREAHRYAYELCVGPIPPGHEIDHKCRVRHCVNPDHLQVVPRGWNGAQGFELAAQMKRQATHCKRGHPFTPENTGLQRGKHRSCRTCTRTSMRAAQARYLAKKRAAAAAQER